MSRQLQKIITHANKERFAYIRDGISNAAFVYGTISFIAYMDIRNMDIRTSNLEHLRDKWESRYYEIYEM